MTLSARNKILLLSFTASLAPILAFAVSAGESFAIAGALRSGAIHRAGGLLQIVGRLVSGGSTFAPLAGIVFASVFASATVALLYYSFEKTQAPETLFFALFAFSLGAEAFRLSVPLAASRSWPPAFVVGASRGLVFGRFFGLLCLFASSVYACGVDFQKHGRVILIAAAAALAIATGVPVDGLSWDSSLTPVTGYAGMLDTVEWGIAAIACLSYLVAARTRGASEFAAAAAGCALVCIGRDGAARADNWAVLAAAAAALVAGTWILSVRVHRYYLWL